MADLFDEEYADELDAIADVGDEFHIDDPYAPKSKKTLQFTTPKQKQRCNSDCIVSPTPLTPIDSPLIKGNNREAASGVREKRARDDGDCCYKDLSDSDHDEKEDDLPTIGKKAKRARIASGEPRSPSPPPNNVLSSQVRVGNGSARNGLGDTDMMRNGTAQSGPRQYSSQKETNNIHIDDMDDDFMDDYELVRPRVFSRIPAEGDYMAVTDTEGRRAYMRLRNMTELERQYESVGQSAKTSQLLTIPVSVLRYQAEEDRRRLVIEEAERISRDINRDMDRGVTSLYDKEGETGTEEERRSAGATQQSLWVDKYSPHRYTDLLSEETLNRSLLHWLKLWDYVVFGRDLPVKKNPKKKEEKKKKWKQPEILEELDKFNRPQQKVALLCGPPGLGKTTLAHVVAKHAGYNVVEMNASDDRSADLFRKKLEDSTQMKSVLGNDQRPNCLIIDEIDGAPQAAINILLKLIQRTDHSTTKKKNEGFILYRPIICICNDQYVPALRQLRPLAMLLHFPPTETTKLAGRLYEIVREEQIKAEMNALLALCEKSHNDIRSCLNTLQFVRQQKQEFSLRLVQGMTVGQKDSHKSLFSLWYEIFTMPRAKKNKFVNIHDLQEGHRNVNKGNNTTPANRFQTILMAAYAAGEYEKVMQGVFENYLEAKCKDPRLDTMTSATEWLCFVDGINQYIGHKQDYSLMPYIPFIFVTFHLLYASYQPPKIQFPRSHYEYTVKLSKMTNLSTCMFADMSPGVKKYIDTKTAVLDILHPVIQILQPSLRPVNTQLYSKREKDELANLVRIMIAYNVTYHQDKTPEGQYVYVLDPNVEEIVRFPGMKQNRPLTYAAKQLIAREIELERMRMSEVKLASKNVGSQLDVSAIKDNIPAVPNHRKKLEAKAVAEEKPMKNFFGNFTRTKRSSTVNTKQSTSSKENTNEKKKDVLATDIWFHFKEGFSNAVRRNVRVQDLL